MQFPFSMVGPMRHTGEHTKGAGASHQAREGGARDLHVSCGIDDGCPSQHRFDCSQIPQKALAHRAFQGGVIKGREPTRVVGLLWLFLFRRNGHLFGQLRRQRIGENGKSVRSQTHQRREPRERDGREIDEQMPTGSRISTALPDGGFPLRLGPAVSEPFGYFLHTGRLTPRPHDRQCLFKLLPAGKRLTPSVQKDQIRVTGPGQGGLRPNPIDPSLSFDHFSRRFSFDAIALLAFVLLQPGLGNEQATVEELTDGIGKVDVTNLDTVSFTYMRSAADCILRAHPGTPSNSGRREEGGNHSTAYRPIHCFYCAWLLITTSCQLRGSFLPCL